MIVGEVRRYLRDNSSYRIPRSLRDTAYRAIHTRELLSHSLSHEPTLDEIAKDAAFRRRISSMRSTRSRLP
jgi:RNA polymerase sporulation-specific sigma factor